MGMDSHAVEFVLKLLGVCFKKEEFVSNLWELFGYFDIAANEYGWSVGQQDVG